MNINKQKKIGEERRECRPLARYFIAVISTRHWVRRQNARHRRRWWWWRQHFLLLLNRITRWVLYRLSISIYSHLFLAFDYRCVQLLCVIYFRFIFFFSFIARNLIDNKNTTWRGLTNKSICVCCARVLVCIRIVWIRTSMTIYYGQCTWWSFVLIYFNPF